MLNRIDNGEKVLEKVKKSSANEKIYSSKEISGIGTLGTMRLLKGKVAKFLNYIGRSFAYSSTRSYGTFLLSFGIMSLLLNLSEYYFNTEPQVALSSLVIGAVLALISIPLLIFDRPMCIAVQDFFITDYLFFEFLSIKRMHRNFSHPTIPPVAGLFLGVIPAALSFLISIEWIILALVVIAVVTVAFTTPEFPMILALILVPYLPVIPASEWVLTFISLVTFFSFAFKVILGKRVYNFSIYDALIFIIILFALVGGIVGYGGDSFKNSVIFAVLLLGYFPASNLIVNRRLADCAIKAVIVSSIPITAIAIIEFIVELPITKFDVPSYSTPGTSALFTSPPAFAAFLMVSASLTLAFAIEKKHKAKKIFYFSVFVIELLVLGLTVQPAVWVTMIAALLAYLIITSRKIPRESLLLLILLPYLFFLIPGKNLNTVSDFLNLPTSFSEKIAAYRDALLTVKENMWLGVGIGDESYIAATGGKSPIFNLFVGIGVELGVLVLAIFVVMMLIRFRHLSYYRYYMRNSLVGIDGNMCAVATVILLVFGVDAYIFADRSVLYLFWLVFGICTAALRTAKREYDDRLSYYGDSSSSEYSALDIGIRK